MDYIEVKEGLSKFVNLKFDDSKWKRCGDKGEWVLNVPIAFDIETTSSYVNGDKVGFMYIWMVAIEEDLYVGRTWNEFVDFINSMCEQNGTNCERRIVIYVHNLSYEFQFIRKLFEWDERRQLNVDMRKVAKATTTYGVEFRCSYLLSNAPLRGLHTKKYHKAVGDLNYDLVRNSYTTIDDIEMGYCLNDVLVVTEYVAGEIEHYGSIGKIPSTSTGAVRKYCRERTVRSLDSKSYRDFIRKLILTPDEYEMLKRGFQGGFTHASMWHSGITMNDVTSYDFTSSYPAVMCSEMFPISCGQPFGKIPINKYIEMCKCSCVLAEVTIIGLKEKLDYDHPLSFSKCYGTIGTKCDNGRVISADALTTIVTEQDFITYSRFYEWDNISINKGYHYIKGYLPRELIKCILDFYQAKTTLKGVDEQEDEYMRKKAMLNSVYGMCVTDIVKDSIKYTENGWVTVPAELKLSIDKYNGAKDRFLFYPWGVWTTAYARRNLFTGIEECGYDYIYADTDSVKIMHPEKHKEYFEWYNGNIISKVRRMARHYNFEIDLIEPRTIKGESKPLGVWDYDGHYRKFKTLGAKRYLTEDDNGKLHLTISGVQKKAGERFLSTLHNPFDSFCEGLIFDSTATGKMTHTYIDDCKEFDITDYQGHTEHITAPSGIHLEGCEYEMSLANDYISLLQVIRGEFLNG